MIAWTRTLHRCAVTLLLAAVACGGNAGGSGNDGASTRDTASPPAASAEPGSDPTSGRDAASPGDSSTRGDAPSQGGTTIGRPRIAVLGDSLTAGLGLSPDAAYPALLQRHLDEEGLQYEVVNAGVSGDTSAGGLSRLDWALEGDVRVLIVALGANDALRGLPVEALRRNLSTIIERAQVRQIAVLLAGMEAPPNFGQPYTASFRKVYADLAGQYKVAFVPFLLDNVAGIESLNQRDGIHPSAEGARIIADSVWRTLGPMLR